MIATYLKTLGRMFRHNVTRLLSVVFMVLLSVGFCSGIGSTTDKINYSMTDYYIANNVSDIIVKGVSPLDVAAIEARYGAENVNFGFSFEMAEEDGITRVYVLDFSVWTINKPDFVKGGEGKAYSERADKKIRGIAVGEEAEITFSAAGLPPVNIAVEISAEIQSPLTFARDGEPAWTGNEGKGTPSVIKDVNTLIPLKNIIYIDKTLLPFLPLTDAYIKFSDHPPFGAMSEKYLKAVRAEGEELKSLLGGGVNVLTLEDNYSFKALRFYGDKVMTIGYMLMAVFMLVTALVVLSTMTRLIEEERAQIACMKTLGYSDFAVISKYIFFALIGTGIGGVSAYFVGLGIARLIYFVFNFSFDMPPISSHVAIVFFIITLSVIVTATVAANIIAGLNLVRKKPAVLLRPKPPRSGRKVLLERIPFIWNRLSFKYKSTVRNVLRYKSRFFMTVFAVAISMALVMAGLTLLDICLFRGVDSVSIMMVALVIVLFAGLLTAIVIYTLTNINISERNRELATLMVLGYTDNEVTLYIYREIFIDTVIGVILGYPLSAAIMAVLFSIMAAGTYATVMWAVAPLVVFAFTGIVMLILRRKIVKIDMNESLKAIE